MKARALVSIVILVLAVLIIAGSCATNRKTYVSSDYVLKELTGTWYNEEYENSPHKSKVIVNPDGTKEAYKKWVDTTRITHVEAKLIEFYEKWTDTKGDVWYQAQYLVEAWNWTMYELGKINNTGKVWESVYSIDEYPNEIDPENANYKIYYRQE